MDVAFAEGEGVEKESASPRSFEGGWQRGDPFAPDMDQSHHLQKQKQQDFVPQIQAFIAASRATEIGCYWRDYKVFICYCGPDRALADKIYRALEGRYRPFIHYEDMPAGRIWREDLENRIEDSDAVLVLMSKKSKNRDGHHIGEINKAVELSKTYKNKRNFRIIPVLLDDVSLDRDLEEYNAVKMFEDWGEGLKKVDEGLQDGMKMKMRCGA